MPLPSSWVERIFARMAVRYGVTWLRMWEGLDLALVKADWANELGLFDGDAIVYALGFLPIDWPPTVAQFAELCARAPRREVKPQQPLLPPPPADPERLKAELQRLHELLSARGRLDWAYEMQEREKRGEELTEAQRLAWRNAVHEIDERTVMGEFSPIRPEYLPPAMRPKQAVTEDERMAA